MKCDSHASLLARTLANPCLGREPKARVVTFASSHRSAQLPTRAFQLATLGNQMIFFCSSIYKIIA